MRVDRAADSTWQVEPTGRLRGLFLPTYALPVDLFRVLVGLLSAAYFAHLLLQVRDFSGPNGLIDHQLTREMFWYTRMGLFHPWMGEGAFIAVYASAVVTSVALVAGYRVRLAAALLFVLAVSAYRWNFIVVYVDDGLMHLALFWLLLLPIGKTLVLSDWLRDRRGAMARWTQEVVPGGALRCFLVNLALVDLIAGLWKLTSPMWRDGTALYAVLRMPIAYAPDFWSIEHLPLLRAANYAAVAVELVVPAMFVFALPRGLKWLLLAGAITLHLGIVATMRVPYANLVCLAAMVLAFRREIMARVRGSREWKKLPELRAGWRDRAALAFVGLLVCAMAAETQVPAWRFPGRDQPAPATVLVEDSSTPEEQSGAKVADDGRVGFMQTQHNPLYMPLWLIGIAQSYRLMDWIDDRNFDVHYTVVEYDINGAGSPLPARGVFPLSMRGLLLEAYLLDVTWGRVPRNRAAEFKGGLLRRFAQRYCRSHPNTGEIHVGASVVRLTAARTETPPRPEPLMVFTCSVGVAKVLHPPHSSGSLRVAGQVDGPAIAVTRVP